MTNGIAVSTPLEFERNGGCLDSNWGKPSRGAAMHLEFESNHGWSANKPWCPLWVTLSRSPTGLAPAAMVTGRATGHGFLETTGEHVES